MNRIRVLVVEDSKTVRARLVEVISSDPGLEVIGEADNGKTAIEMCDEARPDVVTMDMMMPVMSGLAATEYIMSHCPTPILVVSASVNRGELFKIYEALAAGAVDVLDKPAGPEAGELWERRLIALIKLVARIRVIRHPRVRIMPAQTPPPAPGSVPMSLVAIGASTGGPGAVVRILRDLPVQFQLPVLLVQHINEPFGSAFTEWLDGQTERRVSEAKDGVDIMSLRGRVVVAPGDRHLVVRRGHIHLTDDPARHSCRPSVDILFESVAHEYGPSGIACLLTGMGKDGASGLLKVREAGGMTIAQDEASSVVYGMPREAAMIGAARQILALDEIGRRLVALQSVGQGVRI
ncbi:chemotaxis response regulator protein-glutamate methylesterase [Terrihabitans soli]|uniref:Protein-glutamate methylesterase/protein-glutamine glutaminase n=1 Tax=Terrihabitans soli TaxID=708113 RepID=A0A6S6QYS8_9HYPH|nr:chemotaxis-specific protein-glutamate methyltransferase CheB [Terrihabitans soli]BCJ92240.1 chemotaxis response regulator protein-glutamate methylesterase [Terrihabitans soli]